MNNELIKLQKAELVFQVIKVLLAIYIIGVSLISLRLLNQIVMLLGEL